MELSAHWRPFLDDPARSVLLTDFDGTLSSIVPDPAAARPLPGSVEVLHGLAQRLRRVAVISGRPVSFLSEHVGAGLELIGLYGLEAWGPTPGPVRIAGGAEEWADLIDGIATQAEGEAPTGVHVERKGLSATLHYRNAVDFAAARRWCETVMLNAARRHGLVARAGRRAVELLPPVATDKGTVVESLVDGAHAVAFLGDDLGDLAAFGALDRLAPMMATVKVAVASEEAPPEVISAGDEIVDGPPGALALLESLLRSISAPR